MLTTSFWGLISIDIEGLMDIDVIRGHDVTTCNTICLIDVQQELPVCIVSGPNHDLGFGPIGEGTLEGPGFSSKAS